MHQYKKISFFATTLTVTSVWNIIHLIVNLILKNINSSLMYDYAERSMSFDYSFLYSVNKFNVLLEVIILLMHFNVDFYLITSFENISKSL